MSRDQAMQSTVCLVGNDTHGVLSTLAAALRRQGMRVVVCVRSGQEHSAENDYALVLHGPSEMTALEHLAAKSRFLVRLGLAPLTPHLDASASPARQIVIIEPGESRHIFERLVAGDVAPLARLRLLERHAHAVLASPSNMALCLRLCHPIRSRLSEDLSEAVLRAFETPQAPPRELSGFFQNACPTPLPKSLMALAAEVLALRDDGDALFKTLRDLRHVAANVLLPEDLTLPGGRHLAHYMAQTALCPPALWRQTPERGKYLLRRVAALLVLDGLAAAAVFLAENMHGQPALLYALSLCCAGSDADTTEALWQRLFESSPADTAPPLAVFLHALWRFRRQPNENALDALRMAIKGLPRLGGQMVWGCNPILNNKYWSQAMRECGVESCTLMNTYYNSINDVADYDLYFEDLLPAWADALPEGAKVMACLYVLCNASVMHMSFHGGPLGSSCLAAVEPQILGAASIESVIIPYGSDAYMYSRLASPTLTHALNVSYPHYAKTEDVVQERVYRWSAHASLIVGWAMTIGNGFPRWDVLLVAPFHIDVRLWKPKQEYSDADGTRGVVRILHCPNHRAFKGTDYILDAVARLKDEDLQLELVLLERVQNTVVHEAMQTADILVDQCLAHYALNAIEGMASGLTVCSNLEEPNLTALRRFSYLDECPIVSVTPETLVDRLRSLVKNPDLRRRLGQAGRTYVEKYHSLHAAQHFFCKVHNKLLHKDTCDIHDIYHPLVSDYVRDNPVPRVLVQGRMPESD